MIRIQPLLENLPEDERTEIARTLSLPRATPPADLARHLVTARVLQNALKNELRPVTNLIERLAQFGPEASIDSDIVGDVTQQRLEATHKKGLIFLQPSAAEPRRALLPLEYLLMREIKRPPTTDLVGGMRVLAVDQVRIMAKMLDVESRRSLPLLLGDLCERLASPAGETALEDEEREVLDAVLSRGGIVDAGVHHRDYRLVSDPHARGPFTLADLFGSRGARGRPTATQLLVRKGRLFAQTERDQPNGTITRLFVPSEVAEPLAASWAARQDETERQAVDAWKLDAEPETVRPRPDDIVADLRAFALGVATLGCRHAEAGHLRRSDTEAFAARRAIAPVDQAKLAELGSRLGLFEIEDRRIVLADDADTRLDAPPVEQIETIRRTITEEAGLADPLPARFRRLILGALGRHGYVWLRVAGVRALLDGDREFQRTCAAHEMESSAIDAAIGRALEDLRSWGWVDLAGDTGAIVACRSRPPAPGEVPVIPAKPLTIPPNRDIITPLIAPFELLRTIGQFAEPRQFDVAAVFTLTDASLLRGTMRGYPPNQITAYLSAHCVHPIPESIDQLVADVIDREGEVRIIPAGSVLVFRDSTVAEAAKRHPDLARYLACEVAPGVFAAPTEIAIEQVQAALKDRGFYAAQTGEPNASGPSSPEVGYAP